MSVLLKYQLKALFESGDLMTQDTLSDLIDSTYNPVLVAGTNVTLNSVTTPSGTTITVNAQGGGAGVVTSLTTTGTSGAATLNAGILNIPVYGGGVGSYTNLTPTPLPFPGNSPFDTIVAGTTFNNQTFTQMMDAMLYPTLNPTLTPPSASLSISPGGNNSYQEINATIAVTLSATFNRGSINPQYTSASPFRSGVPLTYNFAGDGIVGPVSGPALAASTSNPAYTIANGANEWTNSVSFDAGVQPKDSSGNDFGSPLPAGTTGTQTMRIYGVYPVFATTQNPGNINTFTKQALQSMAAGGYIQLDMAAESLFPPVRAKADIPQAWSTITGYQFFDPFFGWTNGVLATDWNVTTTTRTIQGLSVLYDRYEKAGAIGGAVQYRFLT